MADSSQELPSFSEFAVRLPEDADRPLQGRNQAWPLIVTPGLAEPTPDSLRQLFADNGEAVKDALYRFGAILFRGFDIRSEAEFESTVLSIRGLQAMRSDFMPAVGRDRANHSTNVFYTNKVRQGLSLYPPHFHTENYHSWDIPTIQSFWCKKACRLGGETGFVHMPSVYDEQPAEIRTRLEAQPVFVKAFSLSAIARQYGLSEAVVKRFLDVHNIPIEASAGARYALLFKPSVWHNPDTKRHSLQANIVAVKGFHDALRPLMMPHYRGWRWAVHRLAWRHPTILNAATFVATCLRHPTRSVQHAKEILRPPAPPSVGADKPRLADAFNDIAALAAAIWRHTSVLTWNEGDVVLFDNRQLLHARMPGFGRRALRTLLCNPFRIDGRSSSGVLEAPRADLYRETLDVELERFGRAMK
jgi:alpha-ketoglutarate-dependent taurine dioxygenase